MQAVRVRCVLLLPVRGPMAGLLWVGVLAVETIINIGIANGLLTVQSDGAEVHFNPRIINDDHLGNEFSMRR